MLEAALSRGASGIERSGRVWVLASGRDRGDAEAESVAGRAGVERGDGEDSSMSSSRSCVLGEDLLACGEWSKVR